MEAYFPPLKLCNLQDSAPKGSSYCKLGRSGNFISSGWVNTALSLLSDNATFPLPSLTCALRWSGEVVPGAFGHQTQEELSWGGIWFLFPCEVRAEAHV